MEHLDSHPKHPPGHRESSQRSRKHPTAYTQTPPPRGGAAALGYLHTPGEREPPGQGHPPLPSPGARGHGGGTDPKGRNRHPRGKGGGRPRGAPLSSHPSSRDSSPLHPPAPGTLGVSAAPPGSRQPLHPCPAPGLPAAPCTPAPALPAAAVPAPQPSSADPGTPRSPCPAHLRRVPAAGPGSFECSSSVAAGQHWPSVAQSRREAEPGSGQSESAQGCRC